MNRITPEKITQLQFNEIFVFGSNLSGRHGAGAAKTALQWGAKLGHGEGRQGNTFAIPTKGHQLEVLPLDIIEKYVKKFYFYAKEHDYLTFLVTQIGCGLAGYKPKDIAPLFEITKDLNNVYLPQQFWDELN